MCTESLCDTLHAFVLPLFSMVGGQYFFKCIFAVSQPCTIENLIALALSVANKVWSQVLCYYASNVVQCNNPLPALIHNEEKCLRLARLQKNCLRMCAKFSAHWAHLAFVACKEPVPSHLMRERSWQFITLWTSCMSTRLPGVIQAFVLKHPC